MQPHEVSHTSVVRYVPDSVHNEPVNIGVIVISEQGDVKARFSLAGTDIPTSPKYNLLRSAVSQLGLDLAQEPSVIFEASTHGSSEGLSRLKEMAEESTNLFQFTTPFPAPSEDQNIPLNEIYQKVVAPPVKP